MKIQYLSDLHLEFDDNYDWIANNAIPANGEILIMAGDILPFALWEKKPDLFKEFFTDLSLKFKTVYWLPGNHEYYHYDLSKKVGSFKEAIYSNFFLINNHIEYYPGLRIIFTTLWSRIEDKNAEAVGKGMSDFHVIRFGQEKFNVTHYNQLFGEDLNFLKDSLSKPFEGKTVVVTHHVPTLLHYPELYKNSPINDGFVTELSLLIQRGGIDFWIYGHHHRNTPDFSIGKTLLLTNQLGYIRYNECLDFEYGKFFESQNNVLNGASQF